MEENNIIVSICCETYNHQLYIGQCIEGFLMQKTNFKFEILIHDDASTDDTASIIKGYEEKYPHLIKPIYQQENQYSKKDVNIWTDIQFPRAQGKYIALCEGDDYWTDPYKLQKQVDFLEKNSDFSICYHQVNIFHQDIHKIEPERLNSSEEEKEYTIEDLARNNIIHTPSIMYRNNFQVPDWISLSPVGDYILFLLSANTGKIKYFPDRMAIYRMNQGSIWGTKPVLYTKRLMIVTLYVLLQNFKPNNPIVRNILCEQLKQRFYEYMCICRKKNNWDGLDAIIKDLVAIPEFRDWWFREMYPQETSLYRNNFFYYISRFISKFTNNHQG